VQRIWSLILVSVLMLLAPWAGLAQPMPQGMAAGGESCCSTANAGPAEHEGCCALLRQVCPNAPLPHNSGPDRGCPPCCAERVSDFGLFGTQRREKIAQDVTPMPAARPAARVQIVAVRAPVPVARYADQSHRRAVLCVRTT
jgi:hypothetical protein